jgi:hypothetical protein
MSKVGYAVSICCLWFCVSSLACTTAQTAGPTTGDGGVGVDSGAPRSGALSCLAVLQCAADCAASDTACPDACLAKGSTDGQTNATALAGCIGKEGCSDATCVQTKCASSLDTCVTSSTPPPTGTPLQGSGPAGSVPSELVGSWARANYGQTTRVVLNADGTGSYQSGISSLTAGCTSTSSTTQAGNAVVGAGTITIYATDVTTTQKQCGAAMQSVKGTPARVDLTFTHPDATTLNIVDATCAAKYPDSPSSASLYCAEALTKE